MSLTAQNAASDLITVEQFASIFSVAPATVYAWVHQKRIPFYKPNARMLRFKRSEIEAYMTRNRSASQDEIETEANTKVLLGVKK